MATTTQQPTTAVVERPPTATAPNTTVVETVQPVYVNETPRKTTHKRWLLPLWLAQLGLILYLLVQSALTLRALSWNETVQELQAAGFPSTSGIHSRDTTDVDTEKYWQSVNSKVCLAMILAAATVSLVLTALETLVLAAGSMPLVLFLTSLIKTKLFFAAVLCTFLLDFGGSRTILIVEAVLFALLVIQLLYASVMLGRHVGDRHLRNVDTEQAVYTTAPPPAVAEKAAPATTPAPAPAAL